MHTFSCIDGHTCGNPVRVVSSGAPHLYGKNMFEKRQYFLEHYDWIRTGLMFEPRGHDMMSGSMIYPPSNEVNDCAVLFIETSGCLPMCGHGLIGTITIGVEHGLINPRHPGFLKVETPAGLVQVEYTMVDDKVKAVKFRNIPSFLYRKELEITSPHLGRLTFDVSYGGNFYAIIDPQENFKGLEHFTASQLIAFSRDIRQLINEKYKIVHPENPKISGLTHLLWTGAILNENATARNAVFYGDKAIDRSPCGTGTSARMAQWFSRNKLQFGEDFIHESFIGSQFKGRVEEVIQVGDYEAIIPSIEGWAKVYGINTIFIDDDDPFCEGFQVI